MCVQTTGSGSICKLDRDWYPFFKISALCTVVFPSRRLHKLWPRHVFEAIYNWSWTYAFNVCAIKDMRWMNIPTIDFTNSHSWKLINTGSHCSILIIKFINLFSFHVIDYISYRLYLCSLWLITKICFVNYYVKDIHFQFISISLLRINRTQHWKQ